MNERLQRIATCALALTLSTALGCAAEEDEAPPHANKARAACEANCEAQGAGQGCGETVLDECLAACEAVDISGCEEAAEASWTCGADDTFVCEGGVPFSQSQRCIDVHTEFGLCVVAGAGD